MGSLLKFLKTSLPETVTRAYFRQLLTSNQNLKILSTGIDSLKRNSSSGYKTRKPSVR